MPALITTYGDFSTALLTAERFRRRMDGLDERLLTLVNDNSESYTPGVAYEEGWLIKDDDIGRNGVVWEHNLQTVGIKGTKKQRRLKRVIKKNLEGFDEASEIWITNNEDLIGTGDSMDGYSKMICTSAEPEDMDQMGWFKIAASFKGLTNYSKPYKRSISSNGATISSDSMIVGFDGGWTTAKKSEVLWPRVTVTFNYVTTYVPVKYLPMQGGEAPGELFPTVSIAGSTTGGTYHWPNGWRLISFNPDPIPGTTICLTTEVWEFAQRITL